MEDRMQQLISLAKRRGFIYPGSEIYGGLANSWDYGPLGVELKNNIKQEWWKRFVKQRPDVVGIDAALIMNPKVWEVSGHVGGFSDALSECRKCHRRFRPDSEIPGFVVQELELKNGTYTYNFELLENYVCPKCGNKGEFTIPIPFNLMFKTTLGPVDDGSNVVYLRPETAQAMFINFKNVQQTSRKRVPFGIAQIGKAFRNEITPGNFIFRTREFEQMEIEYFIREEEWEQHFEHWLEQMKLWLAHLGVREEKLHYVEIPDGERAHYSKRTIDVEYDFPFGQKELYGLAYRGDYDMQRHSSSSGEPLVYLNPEDPTDKFVPHVIEPTWGVDRSVLVAMLEAYTEEDAATANEGETDKRLVMKFPFWMAPVKVAVLPLSKKPELTKIAHPLFDTLSEHFTTEYDDTQSIGKRYRRQDEIGTPFCITVDFDSLEDKAVTIRNRDTMEQDRVAIDNVVSYLKDKLDQ